VNIFSLSFVLETATYPLAKYIIAEPKELIRIINYFFILFFFYIVASLYVGVRALIFGISSKFLLFCYSHASRLNIPINSNLISESQYWYSC
jgi:hypothetical protein